LVDDPRPKSQAPPLALSSPGHGLRIRIREKPGGEEYDKRYHELTRQLAAGELKNAPQGAPEGGTLRWLGLQYTSSVEFNQLDPRTQHVTRLILDSMYREPREPGAKEAFGDCPLSRFNVEAVEILRNRKAATPDAANNRIKRLRAMFKWAIRKKLANVTSNPAREVSKLKPKRKGGFPAWKPADLDKFEAHHGIGTKARLALALLAFTGARRSDVVRLGWPMVRDGVISWVQHKGRNSENPVEVTIPMLPELRTIIEATPVVGTTTFLVTQYGRPFTAAGFSNNMGDWCKEAGLVGLNAHGVRKAAATRAAERGASGHGLMAMFGWLDIKQAERYTRDAERKRLARENMHLLGTNSVGKIPHRGS
jgi:integrase